MSAQSFTATVLVAGKSATGIPVPDDVVEALGAGRRAAVVVTVQGYTYRTTFGTMDGRTMLSLSAEHRAASGISGGDEVEVRLEVDTAPREVEVPDDLRAALDADPQAAAFFASLTPSGQKVFTVSVTSAKKPETRQKRVETAVAKLHDHQKR
ncbi:YdeI/OmpD-associated family protein [Solicola sp. PLA-1-18]|uniref:YdeI/OmpD-associated family protein n=1 Tax=Solicola sp. PLA-1-18 TaxID=3380532 RepID=UPI003B7E38FA